MRTLSKSDFKAARTCETKLYFRENGYPDRRADDPYLCLLSKGGYMVEALAKALYPDGIHLEYGRDIAKAFNTTREHLKADRVTLFEATIVAGRRLARLDILDKGGSFVRLIEVKAKSFDGAKHLSSRASGGLGCFRSTRDGAILTDWRPYLEDVTFQLLLLEQVLPGVRIEPCLALVDKSKTAGLDNVPSFFELQYSNRGGVQERLITARFAGTSEDLPCLDLLTIVDVSAEVELLREEVAFAAATFESRLDAPLEVHLTERGAKCKDCEFRFDERGENNGFAECWGELAHVRPHVLELYSIGKVKEGGLPLVQVMFDRDQASLLDVPTEILVKKDGSRGPEAERQLRQIVQTRLGEPWMSLDLAKKIASLKYPLHFIDFEASTLALPYHSGMRPYGQVAFQWSCHTVAYEGGDPVHNEWLNVIDLWPNQSFAESLKSCIGDAGTVLTWSHFENSVLEGIAAELPAGAPGSRDLGGWLLAVGNRIEDLHKWAQRDYYHPGMKGRTSIKVVLDALWQIDTEMRAEAGTWCGMEVPDGSDPYAALPALEIDGKPQELREGTGAIRAYEHMMYGSGKDPEARESWSQLLRQYCRLDTLSMVLIFNHWRREASRAVGAVHTPQPN
jgi:hypothetical protein